MNKFDAEIVTKDLINWIKRYFVTNGDEDTKAVIGISGGKDSMLMLKVLKNYQMFWALIRFPGGMILFLFLRRCL